MKPTLRRHFGLTGTEPECLTAEGISLMEQIHEEGRINGEIVSDRCSSYHLRDVEPDHDEPAPEPWCKVIVTGLLLVLIFVSAAVIWPDVQSYFNNRDCANCGETN